MVPYSVYQYYLCRQKFENKLCIISSTNTNKYEYFSLTVKYIYQFVYFTSNTHNWHFSGCIFLLALQMMNVVEGNSGSQQSAECRWGGAGPGLTTFYFPTTNDPIQSLFCFAVWIASVLWTVGMCVMYCACRRSPPTWCLDSWFFWHSKAKGRSSCQAWNTRIIYTNST